MKKIYKIGEIPFYYTPIKSEHNPEDIPDIIEFSMEAKDGIICQVYSDYTNIVLNRAYNIGSSISGLMDAYGFGRCYADEFLEYLDSEIKLCVGGSILEIGCGTGYLLSCLKQKGAYCIGVEPGKNSIYGMEHYGVKILRDFFKKELFDEKFDIIIFYCVLEHIYESKQFLLDVRSLLKKNGRILLAVPNCEESIKIGDISMLLHEHWNYFSRISLKRFVESCGFIGNVQVSRQGNVIFGNFSMSEIKTIPKRVQLATIKESERQLKNFIIQKENLIKKLIHYLSEIRQENETLGIYVPGRIVNYLAVIDVNLWEDNVRFFSDDKVLLGTYYPGFSKAVENREQLKQKPTNNVLVASWTFGEIIKNSIIKEIKGIKIKTMKDLFLE